jgi:hypothetical protein
VGPGIVDLFAGLAGAAGKAVADAWTVAMLGLWNAGLWMMRLVLNLMDAFLSPDLSEDGPGGQVYRVTFWAAATLVTTMAMVQLGVAALRRDGKSLATVVVGAGQFVIVWAGWIVYGVAVVAACGGLTRALMDTLLSVQSWSAWQPWQPLQVGDLVDATVATVLGLMGLLLWLAAIGHLLVMLTRAGALMVLVATTPISAAGLVSEAGRSWFWKSLRWFHAAAFTPVLMVLVLGLGVQMTTGVANGLSDKAMAAVGTALPGVILILIGAVSPLALFKLLAFVDPGTPSGAALRAGLSAQGGIQGLLAGRPGAGTASTSSAASSTDGQGRSHAESAGEASTGARFGQAERGLLGLAGPVGAVAAAGLGLMQAVGAKGAAVGADVTNQTGAGHQSWHPDFGGMPASRRTDSGSSGRPDGGGDDAGGTDDAGGPSGGPAPSTLPTTPPTAPSPTGTGQDLPAAARTGHGPGGAPNSGPAGGSRAASPAAASTGGAGAAGGAAAATPIIPV